MSILCSARNARENARTIRETLSLEAWETLNRFWLWLTEGPGRRLYNRERESFYETLRQEALLFRGVCLETMPHDRPFDFLRLGTTLERAGQIARTLEVKYHQMAPIHREEAYAGSDQLTLWLALLRCSGCSEAFFKRGFPLDGRFVAEFMIFDRDHPRTILYNIERSWNFLQRIRPVRGARYPSARLLSGLHQELLQASIDEVMVRGIGRFLTAWWARSIWWARPFGATSSMRRRIRLCLPRELPCSTIRRSSGRSGLRSGRRRGNRESPPCTLFRPRRRRRGHRTSMRSIASKSRRTKGCPRSNTSRLLPP